MPVKYVRFFMLAIVGMFLLLDSCQKGAEVKQLNCWLDTAPMQFSEDSIQVVYRLDARGECKVDSFYYYNETGKIIVINPDTLIEIFTVLSMQKRLQAGAAGTTINGSINVSYKASSLTNTYEAMDNCQQYISR